VFGLFAKLQRSVFVDLTRRSKTRDVNSEIAQRLAGGDPVLLFGEGTSSDGSRVLAFRTALVGAARDALAEAEHVKRVWVQPLSVAYTGLLGLPLDRHDRHRVAWYGGAPLWPHFSWLVAHSAVDVVVTWGEPLAYDEASDRKTVARRMEQAVRRLTVAALRGRAAVRPGAH
jgi:lyso-ornithine lipid O-acyltransferase